MSSASGDLPPVAALDLGADATALPRAEDAGSVGASVADAAPAAPSSSAPAAPDPKPPKPLTPEQRQKIATQVEFYFSDANLPTDAFLMRRVRQNPEGWVPLAVVCGFNRMKQLLKKHPASVVADVLADLSEGVLVCDDDKTSVRRVVPLPDFDLEDIQARTVVVENLASLCGDASKKDREDDADENTSSSSSSSAATPSIDAVRAKFSSAGNVLVARVRHPGMSPAAATSAKTGLDLVVPANFGAISYALVEYETRDEAARAVATLNDDKDWRRGLRVRLLVKHLKKKKKATREEACEDDAPAREGGDDDGEASRSGAAEGGDGEGPGGDDAPAAEEAAGASGKKKKKKFGRQKRDYSQWASAAAFKENKTSFLDAEEHAADGHAAARGDAKEAPHEGGGRGDEGGDGGGESAAAAAAAAAAAQPTMPDGTRGFAARGKVARVPPPGVPTEPRAKTPDAPPTEGATEAAAEE